MRLASIALLFLMSISAEICADTYDALLAGKTCQQMFNQLLSCSYKIGDSFFIEIPENGAPDAAITFLKSDIDGNYYGKFGLLHGCVIVNNSKGLADFAFISPRNGKVYRTWQECQGGM